MGSNLLTILLISNLVKKTTTLTNSTLGRFGFELKCGILQVNFIKFFPGGLSVGDYVIGTLPVEFRPSNALFCYDTISDSAAISCIEINTNGTVLFRIIRALAPEHSIYFVRTFII